MVEQARDRTDNKRLKRYHSGVGNRLNRQQVHYGGVSKRENRQQETEQIDIAAE